MAWHWWEADPDPLPFESDGRLMGLDPNTALSPAQKADIAARQWQQEQEERARAPVWTVKDLRAVLAEFPDETEIMLDTDMEQGCCAWLREAYTMPYLVDIRQPADAPGNRTHILMLTWNPPPPEDERDRA